MSTEVPLENLRKLFGRTNIATTPILVPIPMKKYVRICKGIT
ncbi:hypothetical protein FM107_19445 [Sphingobacterium sp. JB170]|nr:hypothetical protein FM107_19445 [Sphingobacterium sp. JB170]